VPRGASKGSQATQFKKGVSPNPGGRPRGVSEFRERCRERTTEIVEVMECVFSKAIGRSVPNKIPDKYLTPCA
jgi:hypothetical protein